MAGQGRCASRAALAAVAGIAKGRLSLPKHRRAAAPFGVAQDNLVLGVAPREAHVPHSFPRACGVPSVAKHLAHDAMPPPFS